MKLLLFAFVISIATLLGSQLDLAAEDSVALSRFREPHGDWKNVSTVAVSQTDPTRLTFESQHTGSVPREIVTNGEIAKTRNLLTRDEYGDIELHVEFFIPRQSNSGVYLQGRYEIQIREID